MRQRKRQLFLSIVVNIMLLCACTNNDSLETVINTIAESDIYISIIDTCTTIDTQKAKDIAQLFGQKEGLSRSANTPKEVEDISTLNNEEGAPLLYIVNYKNNQGFVLISATKNYEPILAFSHTGRFVTSKIAQSGLSIWLDEQKHYISSSNELPDSIKQRYRTLWTDYSVTKEDVLASRSSDVIPDVITNSIRQWISEGYSVYRYSSYQYTSEFESLPMEVKTEIRTAMDSANPNYGGRPENTFILRKTSNTYDEVTPLLKTTWGQQGEYAQYTPNNYPVGCVAVAMGQIMKYHEYPTRYSWNQMYNNIATSTTALFLAEIGDKIGMDYSSSGSTSSINKALPGFKNYYGYTAAIKQNHNKFKVINELKNNRPVYMRGIHTSGFLGLNKEGHAWVCDGYYYTERSIKTMVYIYEDGYGGPDPSEMSYIYTHEEFQCSSERLHMNWGWNGTNDGFYSDGSLGLYLDNKYYNFDNDRQEIINIYPPR